MIDMCVYQQVQYLGKIRGHVFRHQKASGKLATRLMAFGDDDDDDGASSKKKRRKMAASSASAAARHVKPSVMSRFVGADTSGVTRVSELFAGRELCVHVGAATAGRGRSKAELEKLVAQYGGSIAQNPGQLQHFVTRCNRMTSGVGSQAWHISVV